MSRRSARLVSGGYYNSDEESDSSSVTNISYRESPVRVFKKKAGGRKAASRTSSRANSNASSVSTELPVTPDQYDGLSPALPSSPTQPSMRTVPYTPTTATPRPALTPTSTRSQTPTSCPLAPPEKSSVGGLCGSSRPGCLIRPRHKELNQSSVDSSGYSSSEGHYRKPTAITTAASGISSIHGAPIKGRRGSGSPSQMSSISSVAAAVKTRVMSLADQANASLSSRTKKTAGLLLLVLLIIILCIWFLIPLLASLFSRMTVTRTPTPTKPKSQPVSPVIPPAHPNTVHPVVDPAVVSAAVEEKMHRLLGELLLKQESLISQMEERLQLDMQGVRTRLEAADSDSRLRLEKEVAGLGRQMADYHRDSRSAATDLDLRIQAVEAQNAKLSQELSSVQMRPPPAPCPNPDPVTAPVHNLLTPELQQAMEKWLSDRIKQQQDAIRLSGKEGCSDCGRPMADKMADFALETQGASVVSTRCSETYRIRSACVTLFGFPLWYPSESPRTVIQGYPVLLPGKCWAFHGVQGTLLISLSHPIRVTHVTLDHLPRYNSPTGRIDSAPKDFEVYGMVNDTEEGTLLGKFTYDQDGESTQTFKLPSPSDVVYRFVELRILSNWGHVEYTCVYRFRVHGKIAST